MKDFFYGFFYPFKSVKFFFAHPKLISLSVIPMLINLVIYATIFFFTYLGLIGWLRNFIGVNGSDVSFLSIVLYYILIIIGFLLVLFVSYLLFSILGGIITAPFNENISQKVEEIVAGKQNENKLSFLQDAKLSIIGELQKLGFYFPVILILFLIDFIPAAGTLIATTLGLLFSFYYNSLDFLDYPMTRRQMKFKKKLKVVNSGRWLTYGFGTMAFLMMFLPIVNVFMKPIIVVAGTSLYFERGYDKLNY